MRMEDLRLNENKFVKIAMWFPSILKTRTDYTRNESDVLVKREKNI